MKKYKGFTVLEVVISLAILAVGATATISLMNTYTKQVRNTEVKSGFESALSQSLSDVSRILTDTMDSSTKNLVNGLCSFADTKNTTAGLGFIYLELPQQDPFVSPSWGWNSKFPSSQWKSFSCTNPPDNLKGLSFTDIPHVWQRCFTPSDLEKNPPYGLPAGLSSKPVFRFYVTPVRTRVEGKDSKGVDYSGYKPLTLPQTFANKLDARDAAFLVTAEVSYQLTPETGEQSRTYQRQSVIHWFGEFQCHKVFSPTNKLVLRPSAFGSGQDNVSLFSASESSGQTVFEASNQLNIFTEAEVKQERANTLMGKEYVSRVGCVERPKFNCRFRQKNADVWRDDSLSANLLIKYNANNAVTLDSTLYATPSISLGSLTNNSSESKSVLPLSSTFKVRGTDVTKGYTFTQSNTLLESKVSAPGQVCSKVCTTGNSFNRGQDPYGLKYEFRDSKGNVHKVSDSQANVGCFCCYGKQCAAIGTKLQSWCSAQPDEAVDSRIPECAADYENPGTRQGLSDRGSLKGSSSNTKLSADLSDKNENCLIGSKTSERINVSKAACTSTHQVLCYAQGRFILTPKSFTRAQASQACYNLSHESVLASEVNERMQGQMSASAWAKYQQIFMPPLNATKDRYVYRNAAMAGIFISPQEDVQLSSVIQNASIPTSKSFWIALRTNDKGDLLSSVPLVPEDVSPYMSYFDSVGNLNFAQEIWPLPFTSSSEGPVIIHHAKTRFGAVVVNPSVKNGFAALCFDPNSNKFIRTTTNTTNYKDGFALCLKQKAIFAAPTRPLQWVASLLVAQQNTSQLAFPLYDSYLNVTLWTGLEAKAGGFSQILPDKPTESCLMSGDFKVISFDSKNQTPAIKYHLKRETNKLVLASGAMPEGSAEEWILNEDDFLNLSKEIINKQPENIQFKECPKPDPVAQPASAVSTSSGCPTPPDKTYTNKIARFDGKYAGTYDDYRGGGFNGVSTTQAINSLCSTANPEWIGSGGEVEGTNYQCLANSAPTRHFHNGNPIDREGGGSGWCTSTAVEWVKCKCK